MCVASHVQIAQNKKFTISLQYLKKEVSAEVDFLHADKHESLLQVDNYDFDGDGQAFPKFPKWQSFFFSWDSLHARLKNRYEAWSYKK